MSLIRVLRKPLGTPRATEWHNQALQLVQAGQSIPQIANELNVPYQRCRQFIKRNTRVVDQPD